MLQTLIKHFIIFLFLGLFFLPYYLFSLKQETNNNLTKIIDKQIDRNEQIEQLLLVMEDRFLLLEESISMAASEEMKTIKEAIRDQINEINKVLRGTRHPLTFSDIITISFSQEKDNDK